MISPLRTWQHQDPKGLWPALGGLAFLAHVGAIGMSVPYLLSWQPSGERSSAVAIPIELIAIAPAESATSTLPNSTTSANSPLDALSSQRPAEVPESSVDSPDISVSQPLDTPIVTEIDPVQVSPNSTTSRGQTEDVEVQSTQDSTTEPSSSPVETSVNKRKPAEPESIPTSEVAATSSNDPQPLSNSEQPAETNSDSQEETLQSETLQSIEGEAIPAPSSEAETGQSIQFSVVGTPQYDPVADFESEPPELIDTGYVEVLQPEEKGCNTISVQATGIPLVYRIGVNEDGTIYSASLQSGVALDPRDDEAVTCLIVNSGITFNRSSNSASKIDDNLLMTFELDEL